MLQMMDSPTFLRGHGSIPGEGVGVSENFLTNQADNPLNLAFVEIIVKALWARLNTVVHQDTCGPRALVCSPLLPRLRSHLAQVVYCTFVLNK